MFLFALSALVMCFACFELVRRRLAGKLILFSAFLFAATAQQIALTCLYGNLTAYFWIRDTFAVFLAALQAVACCEAFWWLVTSLPKFRKIGAALLAVLIVVASAVERWTAPTAFSAHVTALDRGVGLSLGAVLAAGVLLLRFKSVSRSARWHAICLAGLGTGNAIGWQMLSPGIILTTVIAAFGLWAWNVREGPTWVEPAAQAIDEGGQRKLWRDAGAGE